MAPVGEDFEHCFYALHHKESSKTSIRRLPEEHFLSDLTSEEMRSEARSELDDWSDRGSMANADFSEIKNPQIALTSNEIDFFIPVKPKERVMVVSEKIYFRFNKLKCKVQLFNEKNVLVCKGEISGMFKLMNNEI